MDDHTPLDLGMLLFVLYLPFLHLDIYNFPGTPAVILLTDGPFCHKEGFELFSRNVKI